MLLRNQYRNLRLARFTARATGIAAIVRRGALSLHHSGARCSWWASLFRGPLLLVLLLVVLAGSAAAAPSDTLRVRHDHDPWGDCEGELVVTDEGIDYLPDEKEEHLRRWAWTDIQTVDRYSPGRFTVLSYQDQKWLLGRDRPWDFTVIDPEGEGLTDRLFGLIRTHSPRPLVDRTIREVEAEYEVAVKHLHTFGGCEGVLRFGEEWIVYDTQHVEDARTWSWDQEIVNVWSTGRFDLELEVYERDGEDLLRTRRFRFQLKRPLDRDYYERLKRAMLP